MKIFKRKTPDSSQSHSRCLLVSVLGIPFAFVQSTLTNQRRERDCSHGIEKGFVARYDLGEVNIGSEATGRGWS